LCLLAVLAGAETIVDIARFGEKKLDLLRRFLTFEHGTTAVCTENLIRVDDVMESPKLAE
jgi:hypothetical protein